MNDHKTASHFMKNNQPRPAVDSTKRSVRRDTLIQTRVPNANAKTLKNIAKNSGSTLAGYLRKLVLDATVSAATSTVEIPKQLTRIVDVDFLFEEDSSGENRLIERGTTKTFVSCVPHSFQLDAVVFEGDYLIHSFWIEAQNALHTKLPTSIPATDYPEGRLALPRFLNAGDILTIDVSANKPCQFRARLIGRRAAPRARRAAGELPELKMPSRTAMSAVCIGGDLVAPGEVKEFRAKHYAPFRCDRIVVDESAAFTLLRAEVGRDPQIDGPVELAHSTPLLLVLAHVGEEIRIFVQNTSEALAVFSARLHGPVLE